MVSYQNHRANMDLHGFNNTKVQGERLHLINGSYNFFNVLSIMCKSFELFKLNFFNGYDIIDIPI